jgi:hypothetical protein
MQSLFADQPPNLADDLIQFDSKDGVPHVIDRPPLAGCDDCYGYNDNAICGGCSDGLAAAVILLLSSDRIGGSNSGESTPAAQDDGNNPTTRHMCSCWGAIA